MSSKSRDTSSRTPPTRTDVASSIRARSSGSSRSLDFRESPLTLCAPRPRDPKEGKYAAHKDALFDTTAQFFQSYADDELNVQLGEDVKKLTKDLLMDGDGNLKYKVRLIYVICAGFPCLDSRIPLP